MKINQSRHRSTSNGASNWIVGSYQLGEVCLYIVFGTVATTIRFALAYYCHGDSIFQHRPQECVPK